MYDDYGEHITCGTILKILCCPPFPNYVVAKCALQRPPVSYRFEKVSGGAGATGRSLVNRHTLGENSSLVQNETRGRVGCKCTGSACCEQTEDLGKYKLEVFGEQIDDFPSYFNATDQVEPWFITNSESRNRIACLYIKHTKSERPRTKQVMVFSHGNGTDIGEMSGALANLGQTLRIDIVCYDYSGYGISGGDATIETTLYQDIKAVVASVKQRYGFQDSQIILYGQSIGSVPSAQYAASEPGQGCLGLVLHSPLLSGAHFANFSEKTHRWVTRCYDPFPTYKRVNRIKALTTVLHGMEDEIISFGHGLEINENLTNNFGPLWIADGHHNDLENFPAYYLHLIKFMEKIREKSAQSNLQQEALHQIVAGDV